MSSAAFSYRSYLVPGRDCGDCVACCVQPAIEEADFHKPIGATCQHCTGNGCGIYESRPLVCRAYHCGWRSMPNLDESWRPDLSGVMISWDIGRPDSGPSHAVKILITGDPAVLETDRFLGLVGRFIANRVSTMLSVPRGPGYLNTSLILNASLAPAIAARDRAKARAFLRAAYAEMMKVPPELARTSA